MVSAIYLQRSGEKTLKSSVGEQRTGYVRLGTLFALGTPAKMVERERSVFDVGPRYIWEGR